MLPERPPLIDPATLVKPPSKPFTATRLQQAKPSRPANEIVIERELSAKDHKVAAAGSERKPGASAASQSFVLPAVPPKSLAVTSNDNETLDAAARRTSSRSKPVCGQCEDKPAIVACEFLFLVKTDNRPITSTHLSAL